MLPLYARYGAQSGTDAQVDEDSVVVVEPESIDEEVDFKEAVLGDPIVGTEVVTRDDRGQGALSPRGLPSPKEPTPAARELHNLTHQPPEFWCPFCVSGRRCNDPHRKVTKGEERKIPLLVGDCAHVRNLSDDDIAKLLIMKLYPHGVVFACLAPKNCIEDAVVKKALGKQP